MSIQTTFTREEINPTMYRKRVLNYEYYVYHMRQLYNSQLPDENIKIKLSTKYLTKL